MVARMTHTLGELTDLNQELDVNLCVPSLFTKQFFLRNAENVVHKCLVQSETS